MTAAERRMALTPDLVARAARAVPDPGPLSGSTYLADANDDALVRGTLAQAPPEGLWVFAYGSLLWKPAFEFEATRRATVRGWHRAFCIAQAGEAKLREAITAGGFGTVPRATETPFNMIFEARL